MTNYLTRAPHSDLSTGGAFVAPNAALLIDFDNVTMGMRSDLAKELKSLLDSDIIKGKVTVQRAYADWRRYPQYIVPLSEASIDLIFAPAYGSSKKNATDIRMAIDGMELVFIRPEIGTYILLTGDSDFSSLVLKLKEYGKYVIGIGIQESSSDILVQNCDEYYSYTALSGLRKTTDQDSQALDPWQCVEEAVKRMADRGDVMRSDRLKQVMLELSPTFDERNLGFRKFSKFLVDAAGKGLLTLQRGENGQYEVGVATKGAQSGGGNSRGRGGRGRGRGGSAGQASDVAKRDGERSRGDRKPAGAEKTATAEQPAGGESGGSDTKPDVAAALDLLGEAMEALAGEGRSQAMDSDVKRRILSMDRSFDEGELGFAKFSQFLAHAEEQGVVSLKKLETGNYEVSGTNGAAQPPVSEPSQTEATDAMPSGSTERPSPQMPEKPPEPPASRDDVEPRGVLGLRGLLGRLGPRRGERTTRRPTGEGVRIAPEQTRTPPVSGNTGGRQEPQATEEPRRDVPATETRQPDVPVSETPQPQTPTGDGPVPNSSSGGGDSLDLRELGLPSSSEAMTSYLANRYRGVGQKTAETLVASLGTELFDVLQNEPERIKGLVGESRAEQVLTAWREDYRRRVERAAARAPAG